MKIKATGQNSYKSKNYAPEKDQSVVPISAWTHHRLSTNDQKQSKCQKFQFKNLNITQ